jgi:hypothetical protein
VGRVCGVRGTPGGRRGRRTADGATARRGPGRRRAATDHGPPHPTPGAAFDLLVLDAFSSDAVPVHLLTVESMATAMRTVAPGGMIAVHISNRFLDLEPIVAAGAKADGFVSIIGSDIPAAELSDLADPSQWVVVGRSYADLADLATSERWRTAHADGRRPWTDRYSDLIGAIRD